MNRTITLQSPSDPRIIGEGQPTFIIAELSGNHHQKYDEAVSLIHAAAEAGADAVKLQTYTADTITIKSDKKWFVVGGKDQPESWKNKTIYDLYELAHTPWDWQAKLKREAEKLGLILFSTPFDNTAVDFLEELNVPCYKIASYEVVHIPLIKKIAQTGKPVIMSIGFATPQEISWALETLHDNGVKEILVMHCVTAYASEADVSTMNLSTIKDIESKYGVLGGFSDNNGGTEVPIAAATLYGAHAIEKHLILDKDSSGPDARFSISPDEMKRMIGAIRSIEKEGLDSAGSYISEKLIERVNGVPQYGPASKQEEENTMFRPSIWITANLKKGDTIKREHLRVARPQAGLHPIYLEGVIGKVINQDIDAPHPLTKETIKGVL